MCQPLLRAGLSLHRGDAGHPTSCAIRVSMRMPQGVCDGPTGVVVRIDAHVTSPHPTQRREFLKLATQCEQEFNGQLSTIVGPGLLGAAIDVAQSCASPAARPRTFQDTLGEWGKAVVRTSDWVRQGWWPMSP